MNHKKKNHYDKTINVKVVKQHVLLLSGVTTQTLQPEKSEQLFPLPPVNGIVGRSHSEPPLCLQMELVTPGPARSQTTPNWVSGIIRWRWPGPPCRERTSSCASRQDAGKPESPFMLPKNIWTAGRRRGGQGKWWSW